jgi:hypothetical protein
MYVRGYLQGSENGRVVTIEMILEYDEFCMFLLNIQVFNTMTPDFPYTSENKTKCTILYQKFRNSK